MRLISLSAPSQTAILKFGYGVCRGMWSFNTGYYAAPLFTKVCAGHIITPWSRSGTKISHKSVIENMRIEQLSNIL